MKQRVCGSEIGTKRTSYKREIERVPTPSSLQQTWVMLVIPLVHGLGNGFANFFSNSHPLIAYVVSPPPALQICAQHKWVEHQSLRLQRMHHEPCWTFPRQFAWLVVLLLVWPTSPWKLHVMRTLSSLKTCYKHKTQREDEWQDDCSSQCLTLSSVRKLTTKYHKLQRRHGCMGEKYSLYMMWRRIKFVSCKQPIHEQWSFFHFLASS